MTDLCALDALTLRGLIGRKAVSPVELLDACIARIEAVNPAVNAFVTTSFDRARAEARRAEEKVMKGEPLGLLHGLPIGIKDLSETEGVLTSYGSELFADYVPKADERLVTSVRGAGAIVVGKTNTPEFGAGANTTNRLFGPTRNPFDTARTPAGSSGGGAVALACGMVPLATGSDHGGSLRTPAAYCGISGFRPSPGLVAHERRGVGYTPLPVQGPMGRSVRDMGLLLAGMLSADERDPLLRDGDPAAFANLPPADLSSLKVAISEDLGFAPVDDGIRRTFRSAVERFASVFARADKVDPDLHDADDIFDVLRATVFLAGHREKVEKTPDKVGPNVTDNVEFGLSLSLADGARAMAAHTALYRRFLAFMDDYDILISPCAAVPPFPVEQLYCDTINGETLANYYRWLGLAYGLTLTSHPVVVIPCGLDPTGTPFGIQICGRRGADLAVLAISAALEEYLAGLAEIARPVPQLDRLIRVEAAYDSGPSVGQANFADEDKRMDPNGLPFDLEVMLKGLRPWVECESPTWDAGAVNRAMDLAAHDLAVCGARIERIPGRMGFGDCVRATFPHPQAGEPGILVMGHLDTVHPNGTLAMLPWRRDGDVCFGPGICDMKGGNYLSLEAVRQLIRAGIPTPLPITFLFTSDEEAGSPSTRDLIEGEAARHKYVLVPEPARRDGGVVTGRYAIARFDLETAGQPSHAGAHLAEGRSAIREMARRVIEIEEMTSEDCTFSVGVIHAGQWVNCVSSSCRAEALSMARRQQDLDRGVQRMLDLAGTVNDITLTVTRGVTRPVWETDARTMALYQQASVLARSIGFDIPHQSSGGGSDGNFTGAMGIPTLDGLGVQGAGYHTLQEHIEVDSLVQRGRLMAGLLATLQ